MNIKWIFVSLTTNEFQHKFKDELHEKESEQYNKPIKNHFISKMMNVINKKKNSEINLKKNLIKIKKN